MKEIFAIARKLAAQRRAVTSIEYGLTAALIAGVIVTAVLSIENTFASQTSNKCYTLGSLVTPGKI